jgi:hypothetical protein
VADFESFNNKNKKNKMWKCPNCNNEVDHLQYSVNTCSNEYGTADLSDKKEIGKRNIVCDYNSDDYGDSDWNGDPEYTCPECDDEIDPEDLIWENDNEENEEEKPKTEPEPEETLHKIITPLKNIIKTDLPKSIKGSIICKNKKCLHIFVVEEEKYKCLGDNDEVTFECPKCSTSMTHEEYENLLDNDYY